MTMKLSMLLIPVLFFLFYQNSVKSNKDEHKRISVTGLAVNSKDAALVLVKDDGYYILNGISEWDSAFENRKVKVTGVLKQEYHNKKSTDSLIVQERVGLWKIIMRPQWKLVTE